MIRLTHYVLRHRYGGNDYLTQEREGLVIKAQSGFFTVATEVGDVVCRLRGRLKQARRHTDLVAVGDWVEVSIQREGTGHIESVAPRRRVLSRTRPTAADQRYLAADHEQVLVANPDQVLLVFSIQQPAPSLRKLDRFLVVAEKNELPAVVCVNKIDLDTANAAQRLFQPYQDIGYPIIYTSATRGDGLPELRACLRNKISVLTGSSGVGKTSLLNTLQPGLGRRVKQVSRATEKGMHTTRYAELIRLVDGGYVADTPGIRSLALYDLEPGELDGYYREIAPFVAQCAFSDCSHRHEGSCAVRSAVAEGHISPERYDSYLRLREELEALDKAVHQ